MVDQGIGGGPEPYVPLMFLFLVVGLGLGVPFYLNYELAIVEEVQQSFKLGVMIMPLLLLLLVMALSNSSNWSTSIVPPIDPCSIHRVGGSPWGLGLFLLLILVMIWYQCNIFDYWNPLN